MFENTVRYSVFNGAVVVISLMQYFKSTSSLTLKIKAMKNLKNILLIAVTVLTYSCSPIRYVPNSVFIPLMQQKGQVSANASLTGSEETAGIELNAAVAVTKYFALMANYSSAGSDNGDNLNLVEFGGGYFKTIGNHGSFETYTGFGRGSVLTPGFTTYTFDNNNIYAEHTTPGYKIHFNRAFLQSTIGYTNRIVDVAGGFRYCYLNYGNDFNPYEEQNISGKAKGVHLFEPTVLFRIGYKAVKFSLQYTATVDMTKSHLADYSDFKNFAIGVHLNFNSKKNPPTNYTKVIR